jgi:hypothetical protein
VSQHTGELLAFLAQFYCHPGRLELDGVLCLQLYQSLSEYDPCPVAVLVPLGAPASEGGSVRTRPEIRPHDVVYEYREDPDAVEPHQTDLAKSKVGGTCYFFDLVRPGETLHLQLRQQPAGFNFGGYTAVVVRTSDGAVECRLG